MHRAKRYGRMRGAGLGGRGPARLLKGFVVVFHADFRFPVIHVWRCSRSPLRQVDTALGEQSRVVRGEVLVTDMYVSHIGLN
jgi:hypothetical protein